MMVAGFRTITIVAALTVRLADSFLGSTALRTLRNPPVGFHLEDFNRTELWIEPVKCVFHL